MPSSQRIKKVNELIKRVLGKIILKEIDLPKNILITLSQTQTTKDLKESKVFVSVLPENKTKEMLKILNREIYGLQQKLNKILNMRPVPKIKFVEDKKLREAQKVEEILENIKNNNQS